MHATLLTTWVAALVALLGWAPVAAAHDFDAQHRVIVTARADPPRGFSAEVLLMMKIPPGARATRLIRMYDLDHSGSLNAMEAQMAAGTLGAEAVGGYVLDFAGRPARPGGVKATASLAVDGGLVVALLLTYTFTASGEGPHRLELRVLPRDDQAPRRSMPMLVELQAGPGLSIVSSVLPVAKDAPVIGPIEVRPGGPGCWMTVARAPGGVKKE